MKPDNDILKQVDRRSGMTVPDDYFANFARQMMQQLPEKEDSATHLVAALPSLCISCSHVCRNMVHDEGV